jgi:hypothetical protein
LIKSLRPHQTFVLDVKGEYLDLASDRIQVRRYLGAWDVWQLGGAAWDAASPGFRTLVILDEIELYAHNNFHVDFLYLMGRAYGVTVIAIAKRFKGMPLIMRSQTSKYCVFQITEINDLTYLGGYLPRDIVDVISKLPVGKYLELNF